MNISLLVASSLAKGDDTLLFQKKEKRSVSSPLASEDVFVVASREKRGKIEIGNLFLKTYKNVNEFYKKNQIKSKNEFT